MKRTKEESLNQSVFERWRSSPSAVLMRVDVLREHAKRAGPSGATCECCRGPWESAEQLVAGELEPFDYASLVVVETDHPVHGTERARLLVCDVCAEGWEELEHLVAAHRLVGELAVRLALGNAGRAA